ncbi:cytochrome P450 [Pholiota conissans]|uniref:Cytochrome P450 n=1 Tax=Pholiota conissans TaxID=109636 RepID=A0A9P5Z9D8_9AGAR|nr:cytochrome P450 [Pholiota conissans]
MLPHPPGLIYITRLLPRIVVSGIGLYLVIKFLLVDIGLPVLVVVIAIFTISSVLWYLSQSITVAHNLQEAAQNEAALPPTIKHSGLYNVYKIIVGLRNGYPGDVFATWAAEYGNIFQFSLPTSTAIYTDEPQHIKAMLITQFDSFEKGPILHQQLSSLLGTGIFNADGEMWKFHRSITRPFFNRERINDFQIFERSCQLVMSLAQSRLEEGYAIDFQDLVSRFTLDSATEFLFGSNVGSLSAGIPYPPSSSKKNPSFDSHPSNHFVKAFAKGQAATITRIGLGSDWPLAEPFADKIKPFRKIIDDFTQPLLDKARMKWLASDESDKVDRDDETLLEHLITQTEDMTVIRDELVNLLVAGRDTTMCLLSFCVYLLAEHPHMEARLRQEIVENIGLGCGSPSHAQLSSLKYMRAYINEVLRLYPPAPMNNRATKEAVILPARNQLEKPLYVPANTVCFYSAINLHRRTDLWGPDALEFDPDRFLDERLEKHLSPNPSIFVPFNSGPRICLGQQLVYREATYFLTRLLQNFTGFALDKSLILPPPLNWSSEGNRKNKEKVYPVSHITMFMKGGLWIKMEQL